MRCVGPLVSLLLILMAACAPLVLAAPENAEGDAQGLEPDKTKEVADAPLRVSAERSAITGVDSLILQAAELLEESPDVEVDEAEPLAPASESSSDAANEGGRLKLEPMEGSEALAPPDAVDPEEGNLDLQRIDLDWLYRLIEEKMPEREVRLGLYDCVRIALEKNQDILVVAYEPLKADGDILSARGEFDPVLQSSFNYSRYETDPRETGGTSRDSANFPGLDLEGIGGGVMGIGGGILGGDDGQGQSITEQILSRLREEIWLDLLGPGPTAEAVKTYYKQYDVQLGGKLHYGTQYGVQFQLRDQHTSVDLTDGLYNDALIFLARAMQVLQGDSLGAWADGLTFDEFTGGLTLSLSQPLLRGRGKVNLTRIRIAENARAISEAQALQQVMTVVAEVMKAYWDYVGAVENVRVRREALANAERLLDITSRRHEIGTGAAIEVLQAKAGVATRQSDLITAYSQVADAGDRLKQLLDMRDEDVISPVNIIPLDRPSLREVHLDRRKSTALALENRPEVRIAELDIESSRLDKRRSANDMLPQVDLQGTAFRGGRGEHHNDVFDGVKEGHENSYTIGVLGTIPIGNRAARGAYHRAVETKRQAEQRLDKTEQELALNVSVAIRGVETSRVLLESNRQARVLQEANVDAEEKRLRFGVTTSYDVLQQQQDLTAAQVQELQALVNFQKALVDLELSEGVVLDEAGIVFEAPEPEPTVRFRRSIIPPEPD